MTKLFLTYVLLMIPISCQQKKQSDIVPNPTDYYGEYLYSDKDISLELSPPDKFKLANNEFYADMITSVPFAAGHFEVSRDTIFLKDSLNSRTFTLFRKNEEVLIALHCDSIPNGDNFLCWTKFYPDGAVKFTGGWEDNEKGGNWRYFDTDGKETVVFYEMGRIGDKN